MKEKILYFLLFASLLFTFYGFYYRSNSIPHYIPRADNSGPREINGVPLVIYQSWQSHFVPSGMKENILRTVANNPEFDYYLYSDADSRAFIKANYDTSVVRAFDSLRPGAYKSDLWRYCILYKRGGVYFDIKMVPLVSIKNIIEKHATVFVKDLAVSNINERSYTNMRDCVWNGLMISPPNNDIFKYCIEEIVENCNKRLYKNNPLDITGPCLLGRMIKKHRASDYFNYMVLNLNKSNNTNVLIMYHNIPFFNVEYPGYRKEQKRYQNNLHYDTLYKKNQVYQV